MSISPPVDWLFTLALLLLAVRATARLAVARLSGIERNREIGHAAMAFGMAALLVPGLPRPPLSVSVGFFAALAAWAAYDWARRAHARLRGREVDSCTGSPLLDSHHALVGLAMVVMLLRPGMTTASSAAMPGMAMGSPGAVTLLLLAYVWIAALVLGVGMTRVLATTAASGQSQTVLSSPATVYACELAMTVLTGLMLVA
jgi:hypothetical protein